jgi:MarR-like DNA-binding transcriptional regulator SgrR of sgrS sRNA
MGHPIALAFFLLTSRPSPGGTITVALWDQPTSGAARWSDQVIALATSDGLYRDGKPALAAGEPAMLAPQIVRVQLRPGLVTHNGQPVTPADVVAHTDKQGLIQTARVIGPDTVEFQLSRPSTLPEAMAALSAPQVAVPRTGPFVLGAATTSEVRLEAWPSYHGGRPWLDRVILRTFLSPRVEQEAFELGRVQVIVHGRADPNDLKSAPVLCTFLSTSKLPQNVAQAVGLAIDREAVRKYAARPAQTAPGPMPNVAQARQLAAGAKGRTFTLLVDSSRSEDLNAAQKIQTQLAGVGLSVRIDAAPASDFESRVASGNNFDFYIASLPLAAWPANVVPLYQRSLTVRAANNVRGLRLDAMGRLRFDDAFLWHP